jgi:Fe-S cluster biogenesis protein NfuA
MILLNPPESSAALNKYAGACGSCPSSTTTMTMGIERVLKEKFGDAVKDIRQVDDGEVRETTVEVSFTLTSGDKERKTLRNELNFIY